MENISIWLKSKMLNVGEDSGLKLIKISPFVALMMEKKMC